MDAEREGLSGLEPAARSRPRTRLLVGGVIALVLAALIAAVATALLGSGGSSSVVTASSVPRELRSTDAAAGETPPGGAGEVILVHVLGAVLRPGLYRLSGDARVVDAVAAAGGLSDGADPAGVNLARVLTDGEQLVVPAVGEVPPPVAAGPGGGGSIGAGGAVAGSVVNLNTATVADLDTLPRIGPALAQRILDWRTAHGRFSSVDDLKQVSGIGDKLYEGLRDLVRV